MDGPFAKKKGPGARDRHLGELDGKLTPSRELPLPDPAQAVVVEDKLWDRPPLLLQGPLCLKMQRSAVATGLR